MSARPLSIVVGSRGIGFAIAKAFSQHGHQIALVSRNLTNCQDALRQLGTEGEHRAYACDVRDSEAVSTVFKKIVDELRAPDVLVNSAGINHDALLIRTNDSIVDDVLDTNLRGSILTCRAVTKSMLAQRRGCIINIGSIVGSRGNVGQAVYSASKAGLVGLTQSLSKELGPRGIRVNLIAPGFIETDLTKALTAEQRRSIIDKISLGHFGDPEDIAQAALFLYQSRYITGQVITVDGGMAL